jgi:signal transduction histidine kinase
MSHELRTPLTGIIGYSELLEREAAHFGYDNFVPDLRKIRTAGTHLLAIINDILDLSKIESGKMQLFIEQISIPALLDDVRVTASPLIQKNGNLLTITTDEQIGMISSDLTKIRQIILNLVSNAAKFTEDGRVEIYAQRLCLDNVDWIRISISDTGIGISATQLAQLFQEFTQADASMTRRYGGTGLGLALSRRLCQMLGGRIEVVSELDCGSTFTVWVPAEVSPEVVATGMH